jgi:predicted transcriptional regulator
MDFNLEQLGITKDELADRVVDNVAYRLLYGETADEDGNTMSGLESTFSRQLKERLLKAIGEAVDALAEKHVVPTLIEQIEELDFQPRSRYGEPKGEAITYKEYLASRADIWLMQTVDCDGNEEGDYHFRGDRGRKTTRAAWLVNQYFSNTVERSLKEAVGAANEKISEGLEEAVAMKIREIAADLKVDIKTGK